MLRNQDKNLNTSPLPFFPTLLLRIIESQGWKQPARSSSPTAFPFPLVPQATKPYLEALLHSCHSPAVMGNKEFRFWSVYNSSTLLLLPPHALPLLRCGSFSWAMGDSLIQHLEHLLPSFLCHLGVCRAVSCALYSTACVMFCPLHTTSLGAPPWLPGPAMPCVFTRERETSNLHQALDTSFLLGLSWLSSRLFCPPLTITALPAVPVMGLSARAPGLWKCKSASVQSVLS